MSVLSELLSDSWAVMLELAPWLFLGIAVAGVLHVLLPRDLIERQLRGRGGVVKAVALGIPLPLCSCGVIPTGLGLRRDGASRGSSVGFLISTPQTGVDSIMVCASFLGWPFALFKVGAAAVTGILGGWLTDAVAPESNVAHSASGMKTAQPFSAGEPAPSRSQGPRGVADAFGHMAEILRSIWRWLALGVLVSAAINVLVPNETLAGLGALGSLGGALFALAVSLPLYVCATASVPIAAALVAAGMPTGAALVFLMAGPASNVATLGAVGRTFGRRTLAVYFGTLVAGSLAGALLFDWLLPSAGALAAAPHHSSTPLATACAALLVALLLWFAGEDLNRWRRLRAEHRRTGADRKRTLAVGVQGMNCNGCVRKVENALRSLDGATAVRVELDAGRAEVQGNVTPEAVLSAIREAGFEASAS